MHQSSFSTMQKFAALLRSQKGCDPFRVLDVGSMGVNGTYRDLFAHPGITYVGLDVASGPNVDVVPADPYDWRELTDESFDAIISGQAIEHVEFPWLTMQQIARKLRPDGLACIIVPSRGPEHRFPVDCYRYYPDGLRALAKWADLRVIEVGVNNGGSSFTDGSNQWGDCHCILARSDRLPAGKSSLSPSHPTKKSSADPKHPKNPLDLGRDGALAVGVREDVVAKVTQLGLSARRVLEIGCGSGVTGAALRKALSAEHYIGIESDEPLAHLARTHLDAVHVADLEQHPLALAPADAGIREGELDMIVAIDVLHRIYDPWTALNRLVGLLRPGGLALLSVNNIQNVALLLNLSHGTFTYEASGLLDATHIRFFTLTSLQDLVTGTGLRLLDTSATLNPALDPSSIGNTGNSFCHGNFSLRDLSRDDMIRLFTYRYVVVAQRPPA